MYILEHKNLFNDLTKTAAAKPDTVYFSAVATVVGGVNGIKLCDFYVNKC